LALLVIITTPARRVKTQPQPSPPFLPIARGTDARTPLPAAAWAVTAASFFFKRVYLPKRVTILFNDRPARQRRPINQRRPIKASASPRVRRGEVGPCPRKAIVI